MLGEQWLERLAFFVSVIGIVFLFYYSYSAECSFVRVKDIGREMLGERVCVRGTIAWMHCGEKILLFGLNDGNSIKVVEFGDKPANKEIETGKIVSVKGTVKEYLGEIEIIAEKIWQ